MSSTNERRGTSELEIGGETYTVTPEMKMLSEIESTVGPIPKLFTRIPAGDYGLGEMASFIFVVLKHSSDKKWTYPEVYELVIDEGMASIIAFSVEFLTKALIGKQAPEGEGIAQES